MTQPVWISSLSVTLSSTSIYLQFNDSNPVGATYTLYRDSIPLSDSENNSTNKFITDDTGLQPGTVYQYTVTASFGGQTTGHSSVLEICTGDLLLYLSPLAEVPDQKSSPEPKRRIRGAVRVQTYTV